MKKEKETKQKTMLVICLLAIAMTATTFIAGAAIAADEFIIYPNKGQSNDQMEKDKYECYQWAKGNTGFDPMQMPTATSPPPQQKGGAVKGAAGGALAGLAIGSLSGNAGKGAAIGAGAGGLLGGMRRQQSMREQDKWAQQQANNYEQKRNTYNRAWSACMGGRGYTIQ
ncbi:MAG: glycine zipper domain-containing protein [Syntrophales bacterium]|jgi:hypothetical protein